VDEHSNTDRTPYLFNGKELDEETGLYYYGARYYDPRTSIWQSVDPAADQMPGLSPYNYTLNNPIILTDPDGKIPWPISSLWKGFTQKIDGWFGEKRSDHTHAGVDINYSGGGDTDRGAPVYATHDGVVAKVVGHSDDKNSGGNRIIIRSKDGSLQTYYMHLDEKPNFKVGDEISEGQLIGKIGGSGFGKEKHHKAHLHYEIHVLIDGVMVPVNPQNPDGSLKDPQLMLDTPEARIAEAKGKLAGLDQMLKEGKISQRAYDRKTNFLNLKISFNQLKIAIKQAKQGDE
jgi:RHS repeat-associated protein